MSLVEYNKLLCDLACARLSVSGDERKSGRAAKKRVSEKRREETVST